MMNTPDDIMTTIYIGERAYADFATLSYGPSDSIEMSISDAGGEKKGDTIRLRRRAYPGSGECLGMLVCDPEPNDAGGWTYTLAEATSDD